ncbi:uncharacterized protein ELE39_003386 [Cryptosporidium sp. chipmunk genotype I]|uniref:uncharacterized protein n=1 Tax=Cryptosporidium sp. chipmunk genotype I TaxID=1280935 RepID=UPI00351AA28F|nr:hypothetical protein ELE39_003386 [Cryptosporidium sp. chipmunk genotype I]
MKVVIKTSAYLLLISTFLILFSNSERTIDESDMENNIVILPGKPYYGIKMNINYPLIIRVNKKDLVDGRYQFECFSAGPDPQGEFKIIPLVSEERYNISQSFPSKILNKVFTNSLVFTNNELFDCQKQKFLSYEQESQQFVAFKVVARLKNVSYDKQIQSKDILLNIELEYFKFGVPKLFFQIFGSILLSIALTLMTYQVFSKLNLVDKLSKFIFNDKTHKSD